MGKMNILVIEDNELNMKLIRTLLQRGSYNVLEAIDAESGIRLARENKPALIIMDVQLPGMDGLQATRLMKEDPGLKEIPVVALTAHAMEGDEEKAIEVGCAGYISKPFDIKGFLDTINKIFQDGYEYESRTKKGCKEKQDFD
jgi:CheY-like chemotaxis protein